MGSAIRLYLDEGVQVAVAEQMRNRGIDVITARDLAVLGDSDINHLQRASDMGRVLCTFDYDFLRLHTEGVSHTGIVIAQQAVTTVGDWVRGLELICGVLTAEDMNNRVEYL